MRRGIGTMASWIALVYEEDVHHSTQEAVSPGPGRGASKLFYLAATGATRSKSDRIPLLGLPAHSEGTPDRSKRMCIQ